MRLYLPALNPTDSVTEGFVPASVRLGLDVTVLTEPAQVAAHRRAYAGIEAEIEILECEVRDFREVIGRVARHHAPAAIFTNSDHLQTQTALAADYFGLPAKDWKATTRAKNKAEMQRRLAAVGLDTVRSAELGPHWDAREPVTLGVPYPCVLKPREGVASEDVVLVRDDAELLRRYCEVRARRPDAALLVEEFLPGELYTLETLGDARGRRVLGGFHTRLSRPPYFIEERLDFLPEPPERAVAGLAAQLDALGIGLGACHTEFVLPDDGPPRIVEVNYRAVGDQCDLLLEELLGIPLFDHILRVHLGETLPAESGVRRDGRARVDYPCARNAGTLTTAPARCDLTTADGAARLAYRPLRAVGERHDLYHTNRDYLGVLRTIGTDQAAVDRAAEGFLADRRWEITPWGSTP